MVRSDDHYLIAVLAFRVRLAIDPLHYSAFANNTILVLMSIIYTYALRFLAACRSRIIPAISSDLAGVEI